MRQESEHQANRAVNPGFIVVSGVITLAAVLLSFAALDDITTDNATSFTFEYAILVACALWGIFMAIRFLMRRLYILGIVSLLLLLGALWAQRTIGPGTVASMQPDYVVTIVCFAWFLLVAVAMLVIGIRRLV